jgi:hypothetical protein
VNHWLINDVVRVGHRSAAFRVRTVKAYRPSTSRSSLGTLCSSEGVFCSRIPAPRRNGRAFGFGAPFSAGPPNLENSIASASI